MRYSKVRITIIVLIYLVASSVFIPAAYARVVRTGDSGINLDLHQNSDEDYTDWLGEAILRLRPEAESKTTELIEILTGCMNEFNQISAEEKAKGLSSIEHIKVDNADYLKIEYRLLDGRKLNVLAEYSGNIVEGTIGRILVSLSPKKSIFTRQKFSTDFPYVDINLLSQDLSLVNDFSNEIESLLKNNESSIKTTELELKLSRSLNFSNFEDIRDGGSFFCTNPFLAFLLFQELELKLFNVDTYTLSNGDHYAAYSVNNSNIFSDEEIALRGLDHVIHEVAHARFMWFYNNERSKLTAVLRDFKRRHRTFFRNIIKIEAYRGLKGSDGTILTELISYLVGSISFGETEISYVDDEPIYSSDIELLADLGFAPDWARPSQLGYEGEIIDFEYQSLLQEYNMINFNRRSLFDIPLP